MNAPWDFLEPSYCIVYATGCFCEAFRPGEWILQPANSFSNLAYAAAGVWLWRQPDSQEFPLRLYAVTILVLGIGSFFLHASFTWLGDLADVGAMFLVVNVLLAHTLARRWLLSFAWLYIALSAATLVTLVVHVSAALKLFRVIVALLTVSYLFYFVRFRDRLSLRMMLISIALFIGAFLIWNLDRYGLWCARDSLLQGHAFWHILTALGLVSLFKAEAT